MSIFIRTCALYLLVAIIIILAIFPFYYAITTSMQTGTALFEVHYWPENLSLANYYAVINTSNFPRNIFNSILVASITVLLSLLFSVLAAYALSRIRFRGRNLILMVILSISMFPQIAVLAGLFETIRFLGLYNRIAGLVFSYMIFTLPFTVWILTSFMRELPLEIEEAAIIDGAGSWTIVTRIFLPLMWPAMVTTGLLAFIAAWNEFLFALTFTSSSEMRTIPVTIALLTGVSGHEVPWGNIMAASTIVTMPLIILVLIFQRKIISGLTAGGVKG
ncbi:MULTISPECIES: carbohydrate ABC transporter permease [unclassified Pseudochrobactrum]|uniref:carbohydrate ABC transporter permease n=1 Tax=Pseudochrobactrum sp. B5 TaxID=1289478 RepID=UPI0015882663|nr:MULTISPECIES: carbohydrate ABC transporter permease [unclassified Pseudochrobactrum]UCA47774.1 carbohydrate ABC transporter permease [Pseudochrobactrum sp. XF203]